MPLYLTLGLAPAHGGVGGLLPIRVYLILIGGTLRPEGLPCSWCPQR